MAIKTLTSGARAASCTQWDGTDAATALADLKMLGVSASTRTKTLVTARNTDGSPQTQADITILSITVGQTQRNVGVDDWVGVENRTPIIIPAGETDAHGGAWTVATTP